MSNSDNAETKKHNALFLGKDSIQISDTTAIQAEDELKTNCTIPNKKFILSLRYNGDSDSYLFINSRH